MEIRWPRDGGPSTLPDEPVGVPTTAALASTAEASRDEGVGPTSLGQLAVGVGGFFLAVVVLGALFRKRKPATPPIVLDPKKNFSDYERAVVLSDAKYKCEYCKRRIGVSEPVLSFRRVYQCTHIVPHSAGGRTVLTNAAAACTECSGLKGDRSWAEFEVLFRKANGYSPRRPKGH